MWNEKCESLIKYGLEIGLIALAAVTVAGLGAFGVTQIISRPAGSQELSAIEGAIDRGNKKFLKILNIF